MTEFLLNGETHQIHVSRNGEIFHFEGNEIEIVEPGKCRVKFPSGKTTTGYCKKLGDVWWIQIDGSTLKIQKIEPGVRTEVSSGDCVSPMPGKILELFVSVGEQVEQGQPLLVLEAMKMEHRILAPQDGEVGAIHARVGEQVEQGKSLIDIV